MSSLFFKRRLSGRDYRIKVFRFAKRCQVTIQDIITSATWKGSFDQACIETMTRKTGRFVPFEMFLSLLLTSLRNGMYESQLGLMTFRDLQNLFKEEVSPAIAKQMGEENRRYLILTVNQPMITHYPLPLLYTQCPDPELMSMTKLELQSSMAASAGDCPGAVSQQPCHPHQTSPSLKRPVRKKERSSESVRPRSRKISFGKGDFLHRVMGEQIERALNDSFGQGAGGETVESLRLELREQARDFKHELARLRRENERLRRRVEEMKIREMELASELVRVTERQRLNLPPASERTATPRCRSSSPGRYGRRRGHGSGSTGSLASQTPRAARSLFNFFDTDEAWSGRRASLERRRSSPALRDEPAERSRRLRANMRSKSLDDTRAHAALERYLCSPGRRCYRRAESSDRRHRWEEPERARPRGWTAFDPGQYVRERREAPPRQRSSDREPAARRPAAPAACAPAPSCAPVPAPRSRSRPRPRRKGVARVAAAAPNQPPPPPERWEDVGDSAVAGMRQLETRLRNLQRMLAEKLT
ncbi:centrosomal protein CCDC61-like [Amphibalanus amphitrite]|uniref:centrosomal protein CCDC61-like n=1 Tax=Amphibalanus amphitrite TaxID=1232801 RepID=UPI001C916C57|nr:centrosomal protein CCDC61-like [Amphibalanus amphitrite]